VSLRQINGLAAAQDRVLRLRRAYYARKRRPVYRVETVEVEKIIYRDGKEPPITVEVEKVKWIEKIVLIPRWGWLRYPIHINGLIQDDVPLPPPGGGVSSPPPPDDGGPPNVTEIKKVKRDGR
jgi:hypothetical protein